MNILFYRKRQLSLCILALLFIFSSPVWGQISQLFEEHGVSPRDTAMGNAFVGVANDYTAAFYNPAGLYQVERTHLSFGYKFIQPEMYIDMDKDYGVDFADYPTTRSVTIGLTSDLRFPRLLNPKITDRISFGLAISLSNYLKSFTTFVNPTIPYFPRYFERYVALLSIYASASVKVFDWLSVGIGMVPSTDTKVNVVAITKTNLQEMEWVTTQGVVSRTVTVVRPIAGLMFKPPVWWFRDHLSIGLVWRSQVRAGDGDGITRAYTHLVFSDGTEFKDIPYADNHVYGSTGFSPQQAAIGIGIFPMEGMTIAIDGIWKQWSDWRNFMGLHPNPRWKDTFQARIGLEHQWKFSYYWLYSITARGGWYYEPTPVPDHQNGWNLLDNDKHVFSLGMGIELGHMLGLFMAPVSLDLAYQHHQMIDRTKTNEDNLFPEMKYGGYCYNFSTALTFKF